MTSHKERLEAMKTGCSLPRNYFRMSQNGYSNSHISNNENHKIKSSLEESHSDDNDLYHEPHSPVYQNTQPDQIKSEKYSTGNSQRSHNRESLHQSQPHITSLKTNNTSRGYLNTRDQRTLSNNHLIHKSESLNALKATEPTKSLAKSSIQQEYHDKLVQEQLGGICHGKARRPCLIAAIMFILFGLFFLIGLTLICLTYIYKNINFSLDKGEMIGPVFLAGSFIFFGVGVKFIYDAHRIARVERRQLAYRGYNRRYVGLKSNGPPIANEKLVSGNDTDVGLSRIPNKKHVTVDEEHTLGRSSQQVYGKIYGSSEL